MQPGKLQPRRKEHSMPQQKPEKPEYGIAVPAVLSQWRRYRPKYYAVLKAQGELRQAAEEAIDSALEAREQMLAGGMTPLEAISESERLYISLPDLDEDEEQTEPQDSITP